MDSKSYFAYSPNFFKNKNINEANTYRSIFPDNRKKFHPKTKESNPLNYYKNFLNNTETFFSKNNDTVNGSKSQRNRLKDFYGQEGNAAPEKKPSLSNLTKLGNTGTGNDIINGKEEKKSGNIKLLDM